MSIKSRDDKGRIISTIDRPTAFKSKIKYPDKIEDCWEWLGGKDWDGYGMFWCINRNVRAARYSYELFIGKIPKGHFACHNCDNPGCVNPTHLFIGTPKDNTQDMIRKGRNGFKKGSQPSHFIGLGNFKLTESQVKTIRNGKIRYRDLKDISKEWNISLSCLSDVYYGKSWKHI